MSDRSCRVSSESPSTTKEQKMEASGCSRSALDQRERALVLVGAEGAKVCIGPQNCPPPKAPPTKCVGPRGWCPKPTERASLLINPRDGTEELLGR